MLETRLVASDLGRRFSCIFFCSGDDLGCEDQWIFGWICSKLKYLVFCSKFKALDIFTLEAEVGKLQYMEAMLQQYSFVIKGSSVFNRIFMSLSNLGGFRSLVCRSG